MFKIISVLLLLANLYGCVSTPVQDENPPDKVWGRVGDKEIKLWDDGTGTWRGWIVDPKTDKRKEVKVWDDGTGTLRGWIVDPKTNKREEIKIWR